MCPTTPKLGTINCPALFLSAPSSGQGKTTITAALARLLTRQGKSVRIFKTGPDYLDPQILAQASGHPVIPLDLWMAGEAWCQRQLYQAARDADVLLIEGAMGMFDGTPSSADLAARFNIPIAIVMDVKGMAQTAAAIAVGLADYRDDIKVAGLIANNCGSARHRELIEVALPERLPLLACLARSNALVLPERHLGLVQASECADELELRFDAGADALEASGASAIIQTIAPAVFSPLTTPTDDVLAYDNLIAQQPLANRVVAVARDQAFSFIYDANIALLKALGAQVIFFSPLTDVALPNADALWLPGGYPELHAKSLANNVAMLRSIKQFFADNKPILAECGGFLYTLDYLSDLEANRYPMLGLLPGHGAMRGKRGCQGMQIACLPEGDFRAHAHHRSRSEVAITPIGYGRRQRHSAPGEAIYRSQSLTASYLHLFFPSNPAGIVHLFTAKSVVLDDHQQQSLAHKASYYKEDASC